MDATVWKLLFPKVFFLTAGSCVSCTLHISEFCSCSTVALLLVGPPRKWFYFRTSKQKRKDNKRITWHRAISFSSPAGKEYTSVFNVDFFSQAFSTFSQFNGLFWRHLFLKLLLTIVTQWICVVLIFFGPFYFIQTVKKTTTIKRDRPVQDISVVSVTVNPAAPILDPNS